MHEKIIKSLLCIELTELRPGYYRAANDAQVNQQRLLRSIPLIFVIAGSVLILVGNTASVRTSKMACPVVAAIDELFLLCLTVWNSRQVKLAGNTICEEAIIVRQKK